MRAGCVPGPGDAKPCQAGGHGHDAGNAFAGLLPAAGWFRADDLDSTRGYPPRDHSKTRPLRQDHHTDAVTASVRHQDTGYDALLMSGLPRDTARDRVRPAIDQVLAAWRQPSQPPHPP